MGQVEVRFVGSGCKQIILTHMSEDVLSRKDEIQLPRAEDGLCIAL